MKLIPLYETHEINGEITYRKIYFIPKGVCNFLGILEYTYQDKNIVVEIQTNKKISREAFAKIAQEILSETEKEFFGVINYLKILNEDFNSIDNVIGKFESFVVI